MSKIWIDSAVYNAYLSDVGEADASEIMEKASKMYVGKVVLFDFMPVMERCKSLSSYHIIAFR